MEKRGQFYLIAALVIVAVIASLTTIYNSARTSEEDISFYDLSNEINFEALQFLDSGFFNGLTEEEINRSLNALIESYAYSNPSTDLVIIYGNRAYVNMIAYIYQVTGTICFFGESACYENIAAPQIFNVEDIPVTNGKVTISLGDSEYTFNVKEEGQNFFLVLKREGDG